MAAQQPLWGVSPNAQGPGVIGRAPGFNRFLGIDQCVRLVVYDLSRGVARCTSRAILGKYVDAIYHCGIEVYGIEYWFGSAGIQAAPPGVFGMLNGLCPIAVHETSTRKQQFEFEAFLRSVACRYSANKYNLATNNCNNFANACTSFLTNGNRIPAYILWQPREIASAPNAKQLLPLLTQVSQMMRNNGGGAGGLNMAQFGHLPWPLQQLISALMQSQGNGYGNGNVVVSTPSPDGAAPTTSTGNALLNPFGEGFEVFQTGAVPCVYTGCGPCCKASSYRPIGTGPVATGPNAPHVFSQIPSMHTNGFPAGGVVIGEPRIVMGPSYGYSCGSCR